MSKIRKYRRLSAAMMTVAAVLMGVGVAGGFVFDELVSIPLQIGAHLLLLLAPAALKLGYVIGLASAAAQRAAPVA